MRQTYSLLRTLLLLGSIVAYLISCNHRPQNPPTADPTAEPEMFAGHSITDSVGEVPSRTDHYKNLLQYIADPFAGKDELGPAHKRVGHYGIDISHYQRDINWVKVKNDSMPHPIRFVFVKATQGSKMVDAHFAQNWKQAEEHHFKIGAYHFYRYKDDPLEQAANYIRNVPLTKGHLMPIIDVELDCPKCTTPEIPTAQMIANLKKYMAAIEAHYKVKPIIYTYQGFYNQYLRSHFPDHFYWMALYNRKPPTGWIIPDEKIGLKEPKIALWQFTDSGKIPGITGAVDMSFLIAQLEKNVIVQ